MLLLFAACASPPLALELAGCVVVAGGCELVPGASLRAWVAADPAAVDAAGDPRIEPAAGGARLVWASPSPGPLRVRTPSGEARVELLAAPARPWESELRAMPPAECRRVAAERLPGLDDPTARATTLWVAAGCDLRAGEREAAITRMQEAAEAFDAAGRPSDALRARCALSSVLFGAEGALPRVRALLASLPETPGDGTSTWGVAWHRALLHRRTGNYRAAVAELDRAEAVADRLDLGAERDATLEQRAVLAAELGRPEEAVQAQRALVRPATSDDCAVVARGAARSTALAWSLLLGARAEGAAPPAEVDALLADAAATHARCPQAARELANIEVNRALSALLAGRAAAVRAHLAAAAAAQPGGDPLYNAWVAEVEGRLALLERDPARAEAAFERALAFARLRGAPEAEAQALDGRAAARLEAGRADEALADLAAAQAALWSGVASVPLDAGAAAFLSTREQVPVRRVDTLVRLGRVEEAFAVARAARSHILRGVNLRARAEALDAGEQARWDDAVARYRAVRAELDAAAADAWSLPLAELEARRASTAAREREARRLLDEAVAVLGPQGEGPGGGAEGGAGAPTETVPASSAAAVAAGATLPSAGAVPAPGDLLLLWVPLPGAAPGDAGRWVGFAATAGGVSSAIVSAADLLTPFAAQIAAARRVVLLPWGDLRERDLHALVLDGEPLLAGRPVVWSLDLGARPGAFPASPRQLLVADPTGDLPGAREEAAIVRRAWPAAASLQGASATLAGVRAAVAQADALHYAGHATFRYGDVWEAGLPLADGILRVGDVLALPRVPAAVVLSACESGRAERGAVEGWGLAQAFLARGAAVVVATSRPVSDRAATRFARALYGADALPDAARGAQLVLRAEGDPDWSAFRVWVP